ncbi:hypothetical protein MRB53_037065 [Persea americana]|nr:hypothetical protein MRB53_037065 [Persea americana]
MSSDSDDIALAKSKTNGGAFFFHHIRPCILHSPLLHLSRSSRSRSTPASSAPAAAISVRNGPVTEGLANGKRKSSMTNGKKSYAESSDDDDDAPLVKKRKTADPKSPASGAQKPPKISKAQVGESSESKTPIVKQLAAEKEKIQRKAADTAKAIEAKERKQSKTAAVKKEDSSDDDAPLAKKKPAQKAARKVKDEDSDDDVPLVKKSKSSTSKAGAQNGKRLQRKMRPQTSEARED